METEKYGFIFFGSELYRKDPVPFFALGDEDKFKVWLRERYAAMRSGLPAPEVIEWEDSCEVEIRVELPHEVYFPGGSVGAPSFEKDGGGNYVTMVIAGWAPINGVSIHFTAKAEEVYMEKM